MGLLEVAVVAGQARHRSEVVAGCSEAEDLRAVTTPTLTTEEAVRLVVVPAGVVRFVGQAVVRAIGIPTFWSGWLPFRRVSLTFGRNSRPVTPTPN